MPQYHLSLTTDQPVALKTRIVTRSISKECSDSRPNTDGEMESKDQTATVGELNAMVQLLQIQMQNLEKHLETILKFYETQETKQGSSYTVPGFWRKLGKRLGLVPRRKHRRPDKSDPG